MLQTHMLEDSVISFKFAAIPVNDIVIAADYDCDVDSSENLFLVGGQRQCSEFSVSNDFVVLCCHYRFMTTMNKWPADNSWRVTTKPIWQKKLIMYVNSRSIC